MIAALISALISAMIAAFWGRPHCHLKSAGTASGVGTATVIGARESLRHDQTRTNLRA